MAGPYPMLSRYRLLARLGSGGMAEVFLVLSEGPGGFNKLQVLKLMRSDLTDQERPDFLQMFQDEARLAARLNHPNIVQSHEVGAEDGQPFIVMEFLDGQPLNRIQQRSRHAGGGFPREMELFVLCEVLEGLDYAHGLTDYDGTPLHIVHRDVSPQNVFVTYTGQTKLVDFGVAKTLESSRTRAGVVKGKVAYMPPEQVTGSGSIDHRADLFSVGVLLWEAVAGQPMHAELSVYESLHRLVRGELPNIRDVQPEVPDELARILERALKLDPKQRYPDANAFRHDLLSYLDATSKVRAREVGDAVARMFARERGELSQVIRHAMSESNPGSAAGKTSADDESKRRVTRMVPTVGVPRSDPAEAWVETPTVQESTPAMLRQPLPTQAPRTKKSRKYYWLSLLSVVVVLGVSALVALMSRSTGARNLSPAPEPVPQPSAVEAPPTVPSTPPPTVPSTPPPTVPSTPPTTPEPKPSTPTVAEPAPAAPVPPRPRGPRRTAREPAPREPYVDLPPPRRPRVTAPELDQGDPWAADPPR